jgi:FtsZ-binding cell division protein ZapB
LSSVQIQKLKCDNQPDGCAQCVKKGMPCTLTLATQKTYVRGAPQETGQASDGLNLEVERLRADVDFLLQEAHLLRRDVQQLQLENMQLRNVLAGLQTSFPNRNVSNNSSNIYHSVMLSNS